MVNASMGHVIADAACEAAKKLTGRELRALVLAACSTVIWPGLVAAAQTSERNDMKPKERNDQ
jgi:hypothetical protein